MRNIDKQALRGQELTPRYYLAHCLECGVIMPSNKLIESRNYPDGDADCYCPHCNANDCDIDDLGTGESPSVVAWNYQQKRIEALLDELEAAEKRIAELSQKADIYDMLRQDYGLQGSLVDFVDWQRNHITELEAAPPAPVGEGKTAVMPDYPGYVMTQRECFQAGKEAGLAEAGNSPVIPDGLRLALSNAGIAAPESDEMLAATCEKYIQALVTWVKDRKPFQTAAPHCREISNSSTNNCRENAETSTKCWCHTCRPVTISGMRFVVCPDCGNKRCPHANDHRNACTGSNEPGQEGGAYPAAPQQEVKS
ncbi:ead/Ea22-like family protein [Enterobacter mori]|uniref:Uncharacterized protein n=1 Tax=Enterobacter mori TaxID=539813 RepID=A0A9Q7K0R6_9ENTR|nr:hypothetical protein [Enterobacter mori]MCC8228794.1 ead/Ea22-like family protein [Enterobacter mori]MCC8238181.1 ead/Ea22-like family protein [Enterobacter mori]RTQ22686.1 hypothetical protein EKN29_18780 [Enterobacter mori]